MGTMMALIGDDYILEPPMSLAEAMLESDEWVRAPWVEIPELEYNKQRVNDLEMQLQTLNLTVRDVQARHSDLLQEHGELYERHKILMSDLCDRPLQCWVFLELRGKQSFKGYLEVEHQCNGDIMLGLRGFEFPCKSTHLQLTLPGKIRGWSMQPVPVQQSNDESPFDSQLDFFVQDGTSFSLLFSTVSDRGKFDHMMRVKN